MPENEKTQYHTKSAVLFLVFNRPALTQLVFEQIKAAQPRRLYIAADGPRPDFPGDELLCQQTREIVGQIDWDCQLKTIFREQNEGCRDGVSAAINWFFSNEEEGIVLEDDCLPSNSFFRFCDVMLEKYRFDARIRHITGCNLQQEKKWGSASYYFSNRTHVWGWATWRRVWDGYDINLETYNSENVKDLMQNIYPDSLVAECWAGIFESVKAGKLNSWAYPLDFANFFNNGLTIIPNHNLISNIGFNRNATHTIDESSSYANIALCEIGEIKHPHIILPQKEADLAVLFLEFGIEKKRRRQNSPRYKIKRWFKSVFNK